MTLPRTAALVAALALVLGGCSGDGEGATAAGAVVPAVTLSPQPAAPPAPSRLATPAPSGSVTVRPGPFDDRFVLEDTEAADGTVPSALTITSDVSELIVLEAVADFYDADGALLGSVRQTVAPEHGPGEEADHDEPLALELEAAPAYSDDVHSAVLSVPVLVNE